MYNGLVLDHGGMANTANAIVYASGDLVHNGRLQREDAKMQRIGLVKASGGHVISK